MFKSTYMQCSSSKLVFICLHISTGPELDSDEDDEVDEVPSESDDDDDEDDDDEMPDENAAEEGNFNLQYHTKFWESDILAPLSLFNKTFASPQLYCYIIVMQLQTSKKGLKLVQSLNGLFGFLCLRRFLEFLFNSTTLNFVFIGTGMEVVLHEDKKYYPTHDEVYGKDVEVSLNYGTRRRLWFNSFVKF